MTTIVIPPELYYPPSTDGLDFPYHEALEKQSTLAVTTITPVVLSITGDVDFDNGTTDLGLLLVPPLRPFHNAALHVVGEPFMEEIIGLDKNRIKRFY